MRKYQVSQVHNDELRKFIIGLLRFEKLALQKFMRGWSDELRKFIIGLLRFEKLALQKFMRGWSADLILSGQGFFFRFVLKVFCRSKIFRMDMPNRSSTPSAKKQRKDEGSLRADNNKEKTINSNHLSCQVMRILNRHS